MTSCPPYEYPKSLSHSPSSVGSFISKSSCSASYKAPWPGKRKPQSLSPEFTGLSLLSFLDVEIEAPNSQPLNWALTLWTSWGPGSKSINGQPSILVLLLPANCQTQRLERSQAHWRPCLWGLLQGSVTCLPWPQALPRPLMAG